jgi:hypothetical protein
MGVADIIHDIMDAAGLVLSLYLADCDKLRPERP